MKKGWIIAVAVVVVLGLMLGGSYNSLVSMNEDINSKWGQIDNQLQRRADLIPNLVATVKSYAKHEKTILSNIAEARSKLVGAGNIADKAAADQELSGALSRLLVVVENYPNLKADANYRQLMDDLSGTENRISVARKDYNDSVQVYNAKVKSFPTVIWARMFGFEPREYFKADQAAKKAPDLSKQFDD